MPTEDSRTPESVLIIDDHPLFCEALSMTMRSMHQDCVVHTANSMSTARARLSEGINPDIILIDLNLPDVDGLDGVSEMRRAHPQTPLVVISSQAENQVIDRAMRCGAAGFIPKDSARAVVVDAVERICLGDTYTPPAFTPLPESKAGPDEDDREQMAERLRQLTPQQARILELVCEGKLNKQIAYDLDVTESTVKAHVTAILRKLKVSNRLQAVLLAQGHRHGNGSMLRKSNQ